MIKFNVISNTPKWKKYLKNPDLYIKKQIIKLNKKQKNYRGKLFTCTLLLSESKEIKALNKRFRNRNRVTDVLSFPFFNRKELKKKLKNEKEIYLGDIIINLSKVKFKKDSKQFFKVLPLMNANGAISISPDSIFLSILSAPKSS